MKYLTPKEEKKRAEQELASMDIVTSSVQEQLEKKYTPTFIEILKRLAYEISVVGLPVPEACMYVGVEYERLKVAMAEDPLIERLIKTKDIEYKRNLMVAVSEKARTDDKTGQWILQSRYPDEFNPRKGSARNNDDSEDLLGIAMEFIQKSGDNQPLVTERSGKAFLVKKSSHSSEDNAATIAKINSILK